MLCIFSYDNARRFFMAKKTILIYTCSSGGGHIEANNALFGYLKDTYILKNKWIFDDNLHSIDLVRWISRGRMNYNTFYNWFATRALFGCINLIAYTGIAYFKLKEKTIEKELLEELKKDLPDMVISVAPIISNGLLKACQKLNIPFLLIPTDLMPMTFIFNLNNPHYNKFRFSVAFDFPEMQKMIAPAHIQDKCMVLNGFPVKKSYFEPFNKDQIKNELQIPKDKKVILVMMGARSASAMLAFAKQLRLVTEPCHIIFACGKNKEIKSEIERIIFPNHVSITVLSYIDNITKIYRLSDLYLGKAGTVSFCENLYCNIPMILDATGSIMIWEQFNHMLLKKHELGTSLKQLNNLPCIIDRYLKDGAYFNHIKNNLESLDKPRFDLNIMRLIDEMLKMQ